MKLSLLRWSSMSSLLHQKQRWNITTLLWSQLLFLLLAKAQKSSLLFPQSLFKPSAISLETLLCYFSGYFNIVHAQLSSSSCQTVCLTPDQCVFLHSSILFTHPIIKAIIWLTLHLCWSLLLEDQSVLCFPSCTAGIALTCETAASRCSLIELCNVPSYFTEG